MEMTPRKQHILEAAIRQYIETAEPVASKSLIERYDISVSSATVRNVLNELEKEGFLAQMHHSSGRMPTDKGYRHYVDQVLSERSEPRELTLSQSFELAGLNVQDVLWQVSDMLTSLVQYTTIVMTPDIYQETLKLAHLVMVDMDRVLVILLNSAGVNSEFLLNIQDKVNQDDLNRLSQLLTEKLSGRPLEVLTEDFLFSLITELPQLRALLRSLGESIAQMVRSQKRSERLLTKGVSNMIKLPEFRNIELTQRVLVALEENKALLAILKESLQMRDSRVVIGTEHQDQNLEGCSLIATPVWMGEEALGVIGVLGPKRMNYEQVVPMVTQVSQMVTQYLEKSKMR